MISDKNCHRKLEFDVMDTDSAQLELFGQKKYELQQSKTSVRYKPVIQSLSEEDLNNLFEDGNHEKAIRLICITIREFEKRISALEEDKG